MHGISYCEVVERLWPMEFRLPSTCAPLVKMSRTHSHLLWLGLLADALGFESMSAYSSGGSEKKFLTRWKMTCGNRVTQSVSVVGGVRRDIDDEQRRSASEHCSMYAKVEALVNVPAAIPQLRRAPWVWAFTKEQAILLATMAPPEGLRC